MRVLTLPPNSSQALDVRGDEKIASLAICFVVAQKYAFQKTGVNHTFKTEV